MDERASELRAAMATPPTDAVQIARVVCLLREARAQGMSVQAEWRGLVDDAAAWAERVLGSEDSAILLVELADLTAARLYDGARAATWYLRALELTPLQRGVWQRADLHLSRLGATTSLAYVLSEYLRTLDAMPWADESLKSEVRERLAQLEWGSVLALRASLRMRREDTPTAPLHRSGAKWKEEDAASPLTGSVQPVIGGTLWARLREWLAPSLYGEAPRGEKRFVHLVRASTWWHGARIWMICIAIGVTLRSDVFDPRTSRSPRYADAASIVLRETPARPVALVVRPPDAATTLRKEPPPLSFSMPRRTIRVLGGAFGRRDVERVVSRTFAEARDCPGMPAQGETLDVDVSWLVRPSGRVMRVEVDGLRRYAPARACLAAAFRQVRFPPGQPAPSRVHARLSVAH